MTPVTNLPEVQLAAGGIVWKKTQGTPTIAVIHRPKYDDWTLPKGKPNDRETLAETALREVREELACEARFLEFAGTTDYPLRDGRTKVVLYWHMAAVSESSFQPNAEVDAVVWLTAAEALAKLDHPVERELVARATRTAPSW